MDIILKSKVLEIVVTVVDNQLITNRIARLELAIKTSKDMLKGL